MVSESIDAKVARLTSCMAQNMADSLHGIVLKEQAELNIEAALRTELAQAVQAEPVAWLVGKKQWVYFDKTRAEDEAKFSGELAQPLYTTPPSASIGGEDKRHVGESRFEAWYESYPQRASQKQACRDAYAAGMSDTIPPSPSSGEVTDAVIAGALFDFMGMLTSQDEKTQFSSTDNANPNEVTHFQVVRAIQTYGLTVGQAVDYQLVQMRDVLEEYAQSRTSATSDAAMLEYLFDCDVQAVRDAGRNVDADAHKAGLRAKIESRIAAAMAAGGSQ